MDESSDKAPHVFTPVETTPAPAPRSRNNRLILLVVIGGGVLLVAVVTAIVLGVVIPKQLSYLEYYECGLKRDKEWGIVSLNRVYMSGRHWLGQDYDFLKYRLDVKHLLVEDIRTFTKDKLEVKWDIRVLYRIRPDDVSSLYEMYANKYTEDIKVAVIDMLKSMTVDYGIKELDGFDDHLKLGIRQIIGGTCCYRDCDSTRVLYPCFPACIRNEICHDEDRGFHIDVVDIQVAKVQYPNGVLQRFLRMLIISEEVEKEEALKQARYIRLETDSLIKPIKAEADAILLNATFQSDALIEQTKTEYVDVLEEAFIEGFQNSIRFFNLTDAQRNTSFTNLQTRINEGYFRPNITFIRNR